MENYCYLIVTENDHNDNIDNDYTVVKIGKTKRKIGARMREYPNCKIYLHVKVENCDMFEKILIKKFKKKFGNSIRGNEYFKANIHDACNLFCKILMEHGDKYALNKQKHIKTSKKNYCI